MKLLTAFALMGVSVMGAMQAEAQRGGARGGSAGRPVASFHGKIAMPGFPLTVPHYASPFQAARGPVSGMGGWYRRPTRTGYRRFTGVGVGLPVYGLPVYGVPYAVGPGYGDGMLYGDAAPGPPLDTGYDATSAPPLGQPSPVADAGQAGPAERPLVAGEPLTLVFKDGRPLEQVHNYAMTRTTLYVFDQRRQEIALDDLDVAAAMKVNREAGVDFRLLK